MNDLLIPKIKKTLDVIESTCNKLRQEEPLDDGEVYHAAKLIERLAQHLLAVTNVTKEMNKDFLVLVAKATEELMASS